MLQFHAQFQSLTYSRCLSWARLKGGIHICSQIKDGISTLLKVIVEPFLNALYPLIFTEQRRGLCWVALKNILVD